jgi:hypothetical protein
MMLKMLKMMQMVLSIEVSTHKPYFGKKKKGYLPASTTL